MNILMAYLLLSITSPLMAEDRIISLDYCADQFVLALADEKQIIGVSSEARDAHSFYRERANNIPRFRADIDQILTQRPSLVVRSWAGDRRLLTLLERLEIQVITIEHAQDMKAIQSNVLRLAKAIGQESRGNAMIADAEMRMARLKALPAYGESAIYLTPGAFTTGAGTFVSKVMALAGIGNSFANKGYTGWFPIPMERLVQSPPSLIVTSFYDSHASVQNHWGIARHDYIRKMLDKTPTVDVPGSMMACSGLFIVDAAEHLRRQMDKLPSTEEAEQ